EHNFEVKFIHVTEDGPRSTPTGFEYFHRPTVCRHCDDPPCAEVCPEGALSKREDGIVLLDAEACTGCGSCVEACPYDAIRFDDEKGKALKCNLCNHRIDKGLIPACADNVCLAHCIHFGDPSVIKEEMARRKLKRQTR
ncbi:MAG: 4Fe-4S dicluster domain-containing protein, partial [Pseudomonadota bacterium]